jgi:TetR/AcrR family transcriptional regulator
MSPVSLEVDSGEDARVGRRHDPDASRAAILEAAEQAFLAKGFAGASMSEIAKLSGVTKSLIHHHFGSKDALWTAVKRRRFASYYERQMTLFAGSGNTREFFRESMRTYFHFLRDSPQMLRLMQWMHLEGDQDCDGMVEELQKLGIERIRQAQEAGFVREDVAAEFVLVTFLGVVHAYFQEMHCPIAGPGLAGLGDAYLESAWRIFETGVLQSK